MAGETRAGSRLGVAQRLRGGPVQGGLSAVQTRLPQMLGGGIAIELPAWHAMARDAADAFPEVDGDPRIVPELFRACLLLLPRCLGVMLRGARVGGSRP